LFEIFSANGLQLAEGGAFEAQNCQPSTKVDLKN
jgi:hypothetical protein